MPQKFTIKPKKNNYESSKILKPSETKALKPSSYTYLTKNKTAPLIKPKTKNNTKIIQSPKNTTKIIKPKTSPLIRIQPKNNTKIVQPTKKKTTVKTAPIIRVKPKSRIKIKPKRIYKGRVDQSLPTLKQLKKMGYDRITFEARNTACPICKGLNGYTFDLTYWLNQLKYDAPIFEISHVQCLDYLRVWDTEDLLAPIWVNWTGNFIFNQP